MKKILLANAITFLVIAFAFGQTEPLKATITTTINTDCDGGCFYDGPTILINEISLAPRVGNGAIYRAYGGESGEWIELYNPHKCDAADISCYFLGNSTTYNGPSSTENFHGCAFSIPAGTVIPPQGFAVIRGASATPVPAERLVENGGNCVEIVVPDGKRICLDDISSYSSSARLWFADAGSWFAFYDANGVPQDGLYWGPDRGKDKSNKQGSQTACYSCSPCNPNNQVNDCDFNGILPPLSEFPANRRYELTQATLTGGADLTYQRIPDGGQWQPVSRADKMGLCNHKCADEPIITCTGTATVEVTGGRPPYSYRWSDRATQTTKTATHLCGGKYTVTITDALGQKLVQECTIEDNKPTITCPDTGYCFTTEPIELDIAFPVGGKYTGEDVTEYQFLTPSVGKDYYDLTYSYVDSFGCSNTKDFKVMIYPNQTNTIVDSVCQHQPYTENNFNIDASRTAELTIIHDTIALQSSHGCDSIIDLILTVLPTYHTIIPDVVCQHEVYNKYNFLVTDSITERSFLYEISDTLQTKDGCDSIVTLKLDIKPAYHNDIIDDVCEGESYERYGFLIAPSQTEDAQDSIRQELRLTTVNGCDSIVTLHLNVIDTNIHIENLTPGDFCEHRNTELVVITDATEYHWNTGETTQTIFAHKPGVYSVTAFKDPCTLRAQYHIDNCPFLLFLPNAITANGDGLNDCFFIDEAQTKQMDNFEISIFNRWGQVVFHSSDKNFRWKGDFNGKTSRNVVYNYIIYCTDLMGKEYSFRGSITVL